MNLELLQNIYEKKLAESEKNLLFFEDYLKKLEALDFKTYSDKLSVPILVPIGRRIFFEGQLKHTNEITVALGADYFAKCSAKQADVLRKNRIRAAKAKVEVLKAERDFLQNHISFSKQAVNDEAGYNIIEVATAEEDQNWRKLHRENVRKYKQKKDKKEETVDEVSNEELWARLEELELQEELENELMDNEDQEETFNKAPAKPNNDEGISSDSDTDSDIDSDVSNGGNNVQRENANVNQIRNANNFNEIYLAEFGSRPRIFQQPSKLHLFELVVDRHNALKRLVLDMKARHEKSKTESDLERKLDDMEKVEQLEEEIAILEEMLASDDEDDEIDEAEDETNIENQLKKVAFADQDDSETFEVTFRHSEVEPSNAPYDPQMGITKPSDIVKANSNLLKNETTSILKKPKCDASSTPAESIDTVNENEQGLIQDSNSNNTIVVRDVVEKIKANKNKAKQNQRPMSLFKKKRQQFKD